MRTERSEGQEHCLGERSGQEGLRSKLPLREILTDHGKKFCLCARAKVGKRFSRGGSGLSCCGAVILEAGHELGAVVAIVARDHGPWPKLLEVVRETMGDSGDMEDPLGRPAGLPWSGSWWPCLGCLCSLPAFTLPSLLPLSPTVSPCHLLSASGL